MSINSPPPTSRSTSAQTVPQSQQSVQQAQQTQSTGLRYPSNRRTIYDRHLNRSRTAELSRASFSYLFNEMISYAQRRVTGITDLEKRLNVQGYPLGLKLLDLLLYRSPIPFSSTQTSGSQSLRPTSILPLLQFISTTLWKHLFGRPADALERSSEQKDEYMITDNDPVVNAYISVPREMSQLNCAAYVAGIIEGVCDGSGFPARVSAHSVGEDEAAAEGAKSGKDTQMWPGKTVFLVKFNEEVMEREEILGHGKG